MGEKESHTNTKSLQTPKIDIDYLYFRDSVVR